MANSSQLSFAQHHRARRFQASHRGAIIRRNVVVEKFRSGSSAHSATSTITSLIATGTPASGGKALPSAAMRSMRSACSSARSLQSVRNAPICPSSFLCARSAPRPVRTRSSCAPARRNEQSSIVSADWFHGRIEALSFDHLRHSKESPIRVRSIFQARHPAAATSANPRSHPRDTAYANRSLPCLDSSTP